MVISDEINPAFTELEQEQGLAFEAIPADGAMDVGQEVINGVVVDSRYFPAVLGKWIGRREHYTCTSALVGPTTVLIAAHCVDDNPNIVLRNGVAEARGRCLIHPNWRGNADNGADIALCVLNRRISNIVYERISFDLPRVGQMLNFVGFGCTAEGQPRDGVLRLGAAPARNRPAGMAVSPGTLYTVASVDSDQGILCPGDSGGPLFAMGGTLDGPRVILGVNSATTYSHGVSLFAAMGAPANAAFVRSFVEARRAQVCGVNLDLGCKLP